jgi:hypothetical protein
MSGEWKTRLLACLAVAISGCARPRYENVHVSPKGVSSQEQKVANCETRFRNSGLCVLWQWEKMPTLTEAGSLIFKVVRANALDDSPIPIDPTVSPTLILWMPSMKHGSSDPTTIQQIDTGSYRATNVRFRMPGEWELNFQINEGNGASDDAVARIVF